jgi:hypothetical protein
MTVRPVLVTDEAPRTAKVRAAPNGGADCAQTKLLKVNMKTTIKSFFISKLLGGISLYQG